MQHHLIFPLNPGLILLMLPVLDYCLTQLNILLQVLDAMVQMGVLVPTGDMTAVRRTAQFFLAKYDLDINSFIFLLIGNPCNGLKNLFNREKRVCPL